MNIRDIVITFFIVVVLLAVFSFFAIKTVNEKFSMLVDEINTLKRELEHLKNTKNAECKIPVKSLNKQEIYPKINNKNIQENMQNMQDNKQMNMELESDNTENEVAQLEKELGNINELLGDSDTSLEDELGQDLLEEYEKNLQISNLEEINSGIVNMVNNIVKQDHNIENQNLSESNSYKKNNLSELDELADVDPERNSELNELIKDNSEYVTSLENELDNNSNNNSNNSQVISRKEEIEDSRSNLELSLSDEHNSEYNIQENNTLKEDIELELLARDYLQKDLKELCKSFNLSMKGNKRELLERIAAAGHLQDVLNNDKNFNVSKN